MQHWKGIGKLTEECGEVLQLAGKTIPYPVGPHPDGKGPVRDRFLLELGDLLAAIDYFREVNHLPDGPIEYQRQRKLSQFRAWDLTGIPDPAASSASPKPTAMP